MNKKIRIIVMTAAITVAGSGLVACNWFKNDVVKPVETAKVDNYEKEIKETELLEKNNENDNQNLKDGEYIGEGKGYGGAIKVKVTVKDKKIAKIDVLSHLETPSFFEKAKVVIDRIINKNSLEVDGISGATLTSNGLKEAVANALNKNDFKNKDNIEKDKIEKDKVKNESLKNIEKVNVVGIDKKDLKDGEYFGAAKGFRGNIKVKTVIKNGKINEIKLLGYNDDEEFMRKAKAVINGVLTKQNVNGVDTVSGATYSSKGLLEAISNSISKAIVNNKNTSKIVLNPLENARKENVNNKVEKSNKTNKIDSINKTDDTKKSNKVIKDIHNATLKDGEYTGFAKGFRGNINIKTVIKSGKITEIKLLTHNDDDEFMKKAKDVINDVLVKQNVNGVDTVSGATYSSKGILEAINNAILKAKICNKNNGNLSSKILIDTKKEDNKDEKSNFKEYIGKASGFYKDRFIYTNVKFHNNKIKSIEVSNDKNTYGDDIRGFRENAIKVVDEILKDEDKTINDVLEYDRITKALYEITLKNNDVNNLVNEGRKFIGDYSKYFNASSEYNNITDIRQKIRKIVKQYLKSQNKGQALDTVSGATYSGVGIVKSVKNAMDKAKNDIKIKQIKILGLNNGEYKITTYDKKGEDKKLDLSSISLEIHYKNGQSKIVPFNDFDKHNIKLLDAYTRKSINLNMPIKNLEVYRQIAIVHENALDEERFTLHTENIDTDVIKKFQYSIDGGKKWNDIKNLSMDSKGNLNFYQNLIVDESLIGKTIIVRVISQNENIYYLTPEKEDRILPTKRDMSFNVNQEKIKNNRNLYSNYLIRFKHNLPEEYAPIIIAENKTINQGDDFNPLKDVTAKNKRGDDFKGYLHYKGNVDTNKPGVYNIKYCVNEIEKVIRVTVKEINPGKNTELIVSDRTIKKGEKFNPKEGIKAISKTGEDITNKIVIASRVKSDKVGEYTVTYLIRDLDNVLRKTIKVTVID